MRQSLVAVARRWAPLGLGLALICASPLSGQYHRSRGGSSGGGAAPAPAPGPAPAASSSSSSTSSGGSVSGSYSRSRSFGYGSMLPAAPDPRPDPYTFSGQVDMPDGSAPAEPPVIQNVCGSRVRTVAYCDRKGKFWFSLVNNPWGSPWLDGPTYGYFSGYTLSSCGLRAYMPGYSSPLFSLADRGPFAWPSIGKFRLSRIPGVEGSAVSFTTLAAPKLAKKHYEKALKHLRSAKLEQAATELALAIDEYPDYAAAWALLGEVRQQLGYEWGIREAFERALEADSSYLRPYAPLIRLEARDENFERVVELAEKAIRLNPLSAELRFQLALAQFALGDLEAAAYSARRAVESNDIAEQPQAYVLYGKILAQQGLQAEAAEQFRRFLAVSPHSAVDSALREQLRSWGEPVELPAPQQAAARE